MKTNKNQLIFEKDYQINCEWIENINDIFLLELSLNQDNIINNSILKGLIENKILYLKEEGKSMSSAQILLAKTEKESGNNYMKAGDLTQSITHYTYSIISNPQEPTTYCNRALAYYKLKEYNKGIYDCTKAIDLKNDYIKAFYRRALLYNEIKEYRKAYDDLLYVINTGNTSLEIEETLKNVLSNWKKNTGNNFGNIENLLNTQIMKARKKEMTLNLPWELKKENLEGYNKWKNTSGQIKTDITNLINKQDYIKALEICNICYEQCNNFIKNYSNKTIHYYNIKEKIDELSIYKDLLEKQIKLIKLNDKKLREENAKNHDNYYKTSLLSKEQRDKATIIAEKDMDFSDFGKTAYGFEKAHNSFKDRDDKYLEYLTYFNGNNLESVYKSSEIPVSILNGIIKCFQSKIDFINTNKIMFIDYMNGLTKTKSFDLIKNFVKKKDKEFVKITTENYKKEFKDDEILKKCENILKSF